MTAQCSETAASFAAIASVRDDSNPTSRDLTFRIVHFFNVGVPSDTWSTGEFSQSRSDISLEAEKV